ncbi:hypothetical protein FPJ27_15305 [Burkholderia sp. MS455]|uniref:hypothetical protein n=1 Tax=Burkholderia sp. MS455 TaxID=2811788 RepID=UPI0019582643|nr:hypothetical protein [Burkholderia sp. MS455]QRR07632.1 hypothetical protein FPJ27_15305 [Burkholderia sp. MS455]
MKAHDTEKQLASTGMHRNVNPYQDAAPDAPSGGGVNSLTHYLRHRSEPLSAAPVHREEDEDIARQIEDRLAVLDEYAAKGYNPTLYDRDASTPVQAAPAPRDEGYHAPLLGLQVARERLRLARSQVWAERGEAQVGDYLGGKIPATLNQLEQALAEAEHALPQAIRLQHHESGDASPAQEQDVLTGLARQVLQLSESADAVTEPRVQETAAQLKQVASQDPAITAALAALMSRTTKAARRERATALVATMETMQRAADQSAHLRTLMRSWSDAALKTNFRPLLEALKEGEWALRQAAAVIQTIRPGVMTNLKTAGRLVSASWRDASVTSYASKKWSELRRGGTSLARMAGSRVRKADMSLNVKLDRLFSVSNGLDADHRAQLGALVLPLEEAATQLQFLAGPLPETAEKLQRVMRREQEAETDVEPLLRWRAIARQPQISDEQRLREGLALVLENMQHQDTGLMRSEHKLQETEKSFVEQTNGVMDLAHYLYSLVGDDFRERCSHLSATLSSFPAARRYLDRMNRQSLKIEERLSEFVTVVNSTRWNEATGSYGEQAVGKLGKAAGSLAYQAEKVLAALYSETVRLLGKPYSYRWREKNMAQDLSELVTRLGAGSPQAERRILQQLRERLSDPDRTTLRQPHDPNNRILIAGMEQAYRSQQFDARLPSPTPADIVARSETLGEAFHRKVVQKTVSGVTSLGVSAATGGVMPNVGGLAMAPARRLMHPAHALQGLSIYAGYKGLDDIRKATRPGQREPVYQQHQLINRTAGKVGLSAASLVPSSLLLPLAAPVAAYRAATHPEQFAKAVTGAVPTTLAFAGVEPGFRGGTALHEALRDRVPEGTPHPTTADITTPATSTTKPSRPVSSDVEEQRTGRSRRAATDAGDSVLPEAVRRNLAAINNTDVLNIHAWTRRKVNALLDKLKAQNPEKYRDITLESRVSFEHEDRNSARGQLDYYRNPLNLRHLLVGNFTPAIMEEGELSLEEFAFGEFGRKDTGALRPYMMRFTIDGQEYKELLDGIEALDLQNSYLSELDALYEQSSAKAAFSGLLSWRLTQIVDNHPNLQGDDRATDRADYRHLIEQGRVETLTYGGHKVSNMVLVRGPLLKGAQSKVLYISYSDGRVFEGTLTKNQPTIHFRSAAEAQSFAAHIRAGLPLDAAAQVEVPVSNGRAVHTKNLFKHTLAQQLTGGTGGRSKDWGDLKSHTTDDYAGDLWRHRGSQLREDADYLFKSSGEILKDTVIYELSAYGALISVCVLPVGGPVGAAAATGSALAKAGAFLGHAGTSVALTVGTSTVPSVIRALSADRTVDAENAWVDVPFSMFGEGTGYVAGKLVGTAVSKAAQKVGAQVIAEGAADYVTQGPTSATNGYAVDKWGGKLKNNNVSPSAVSTGSALDIATGGASATADATSDASSATADATSDASSPAVHHQEPELLKGIDLLTDAVDVTGKKGTLSDSTFAYMTHHQIKIDNQTALNWILKHGDRSAMYENARKGVTFSARDCVLNEVQLRRVMAAIDAVRQT